jgi:hypothetical protein
VLKAQQVQMEDQAQQEDQAAMVLDLPALPDLQERQALLVQHQQ